MSFGPDPLRPTERLGTQTEEWKSDETAHVDLPTQSHIHFCTSVSYTSVTCMYKHEIFN